MPDVASWFTWGAPLAWTFVALAVSWGIGHLLAAVVTSRLLRWVPESQRTLVQSGVRVS